MSSSANKRDSHADRQQALRDQGFEPGEPVHDYPITFTKADAQASIFESTYANVRSVLIGSDDNVVRISVVLVLAVPRFVPFVVTPAAAPAGCYDEPDWYFEGLVLKPPFDPFPSPTRIRIVVVAGFNSTMMWQVIADRLSSASEPIRIVAD